MPILENKSNSMLRKYYAQYLRHVRNVKESTVNHYLDALNNISRRLRDKKLVKDDIYEITDIETLEIVRGILYSDSDFVQADQRGNRMYSAGLNNYYRFAAESEDLIESTITKMDIPIEPEDPIIIQQTVWKRSNVLREQSLRIANYRCEINNSHDSFIAERTHKPYMETHHAIPMRFQDQFENSLDIYANIVCLCPVCHRKIHYGLIHERTEMMNQLYARRSERLANSGIMLSQQEFANYANVV